MKIDERSPSEVHKFIVETHWVSLDDIPEDDRTIDQQVKEGEDNEN